MENSRSSPTTGDKFFMAAAGIIIAAANIALFSGEVQLGLNSMTFLIITLDVILGFRLKSIFYRR